MKAARWVHVALVAKPIQVEGAAGGTVLQGFINGVLEAEMQVHVESTQPGVGAKNDDAAHDDADNIKAPPGPAGASNSTKKQKDKDGFFLGKSHLFKGARGLLANTVVVER